MKTTEEVPCLYCGKPTDSTDYIINPKAHKELPCCSPECFERIKAFVAWDSKWRTPFYVALTVLVVANLFFFGLMPDTRWKYLPMFGIGLLTALCPLVFARYERFQALGLRKTALIVRIIAGLVAAFAGLLIVLY